MRNELLRMDHIDKQYNCKYVLNDFNLNLFDGEALGVVGLSDSGKTTIADILSGQVKADAGRLYVDEEEIPLQREGGRIPNIFCIKQQTRLIANCTIKDNLFVLRSPGNRKRRNHLFVRDREAYDNTRKLFAEYAIPLQPNAFSDNLTNYYNCIIEMMMALLDGARIIVIDSVFEWFNQVESQNFLRFIQRFLAKGISFVLLGARFEIMRNYAHRIVLLKKGRSIWTLEKDAFDSAPVLKWLLEGGQSQAAPSRKSHMRPEPMLRANALTTPAFRELNFEIKKVQSLFLWDLGFLV